MGIEERIERLEKMIDKKNSINYSNMSSKEIIAIAKQRLLERAHEKSYRYEKNDDTEDLNTKLKNMSAKELIHLCLQRIKNSHLEEI